VLARFGGAGLAAADGPIVEYTRFRVDEQGEQRPLPAPVRSTPEHAAPATRRLPAPPPPRAARDEALRPKSFVGMGFWAALLGLVVAGSAYWLTRPSGGGTDGCIDGGCVDAGGAAAPVKVGGDGGERGTQLPAGDREVPCFVWSDLDDARIAVDGEDSGVRSRAGKEVMVRMLPGSHVMSLHAEGLRKGSWPVRVAEEGGNRFRLVVNGEDGGKLGEEPPARPRDDRADQPDRRDRRDKADGRGKRRGRDPGDGDDKPDGDSLAPSKERRGDAAGRRRARPADSDDDPPARAEKKPEPSLRPKEPEPGESTIRPAKEPSETEKKSAPSSEPRRTPDAGGSKASGSGANRDTSPAGSGSRGADAGAVDQK
jgi:hypothetical protein